jgi:hypothetical protein
VRGRKIASLNSNSFGLNTDQPADWEVLIWRALPGGSSIPNLAPLPLHGDAGGIADLDPDAARAGSIGAVDLLRHDALGTEPASVGRPRRCVY